MKRRSVRQWIAGILKIQPHIDEMARKAIAEANFETGFILGIAHESGKPAHVSYRDYAHGLQEQASGAYARLLAPPPTAVSYEPPEKQTGPIAQRSLKSARDVARERGYQTSMTRPVGIPPHLRETGK